jgi:methyl-accepting chemotaxis protein
MKKGWPRRRRLLIGGLQYRLLAINIVSFLLTLAVFVAALFGPLILELNFGTLTPFEERALANQFLALHSLAWPPLILMFVLLVLSSIVISHRIAGPLYRFRQVFKAIAGGDLSVRVHLRRRDYLKREAASCNTMIASLKERLQRLNRERRRLRASLDDLVGGIQNARAEEIEWKVKALAAHIEQIDEIMDGFGGLHPGLSATNEPPSEDVSILKSTGSATEAGG